MTLRWVPGWNGLTEPEAVSYVAAVEAADGQELEFGVAKAINDFVLGCKNDGIWDAIKACCILAGARTLNGALVPLVGAAPTNYNFVAGDYDRQTGLVGDGSTKYLNSNRAGSSNPQNSNHFSVFISAVASPPIASNSAYMGAGSNISGASIFGRAQSDLSAVFFRNQSSSPTIISSKASLTGFAGSTRSTSSNYLARNGGSDVSVLTTSQSPTTEDFFIFASSVSNSVTNLSDARLAFYSIGEALDLAALDTRVSNLITAIGAAIP